MNPYADLPHQGVIYHPLSAAGATRLALFVRVAGEPAIHAPTLRSLALQVDPSFRIQEPRPLATLMERPVIEYGAWFRIFACAAAIAFLLTLAGIYAVMAFTVTRRTREIGVRVALGASQRQVAAAIFGRAATQVGFGVLAGSSVIPVYMLVISRLVQPGPTWPPLPQTAALIVAYMACMMGVCLLACLVPFGRALRVQPSVALAGET